jgi:hypothetical protein
LLYAIASDVGVMLLVTANGLKLLPDSTTATIKSENRHDDPNNLRRLLPLSRYTKLATDENSTVVDGSELELL